MRVTMLLTTVWTANYFDLIYVMTAGGPLDSTHIFPTYIYQLAFARAKTGMAAAYGMVASSCCWSSACCTYVSLTGERHWSDDWQTFS